MFSLKGGQGKSTISAEIALTMGTGVVTNEPYSILEAILPIKSILKIKQNDPLPAIPDNVPIIYDFGGYVDGRVLEACEASNVIIIPVNPLSDGDVQACIHTAVELKEYSNKLIFVCNLADKKEAEETKFKLNNFFPDTPFFTINKSKALSNLRHHKKPVSELVKENKLNAYLYRNVNEQINSLVTSLNDFNK